MSRAYISEEILAVMEQELPTYFPRAELDKLTHGLLMGRTMHDLNSKGRGPKVHYMGRKACYMRNEFIDWLREYYGGMSDYASNVTRTDGTVCSSEGKAHCSGEGSC